jgi:UDP-N-acetylmuramyl pentapeptide phosphotransferase/UDP-N-acetylglucosamine-1-phosphate transferase
VVGFIDDVRSLPPLPRLGMQIAVGAVLGAVTGNPWLALFAAGLFPLVVNVVNFMDGINGISGAVLLVWGVAAVVLGSSAALVSLTLLGAMALGVASGFLPWNVPRARLFLGDSGSYLMGGLIAAGVTLGTSAGVSPLALLSPLALYIGDVALTLVRRRLRGEPLMEAHREHAYQRLVSVVGMSHLSVAATVCALSALVLLAWLHLSASASAVVTCMVVAFFLALPSVTGRKI